MSKRYRLTRDGERDLVVTGDLIGEASSHSVQGPAQNRWIEVRIYKAASGSYVVEVEGRTQYLRETDRHAATVCPGAEGVLAALEDGTGHGEGMSATAVEALSKAAAADPALAALECEEV